MPCPQCARENPAEAQFCNHCGGPLRLRCADCGRSNPPESRFCNGCGRALVIASAPPGPSDPASGPLAQDALRGPAPAGVETILVVEDREDVRALVQEILEGHGYRVLPARDPGEALQIAEQEPGASIDLLLTDLVMPQMSGLDLAKRLRTLRPTMQVLYMSGFVQSEALTAELVTKPFKADDLAQKVREVLGASRGRGPG
jgi:CheY-like chemotaxis protein